MRSSGASGDLFGSLRCKGHDREGEGGREGGVREGGRKKTRRDEEQYHIIGPLGVQNVK